MVDYKKLADEILSKNIRSIGRALTLVENSEEESKGLLEELKKNGVKKAFKIGITGAPGSGKSTLTDQLLIHLREKGKRVGVLAIDPSSPKTGGAILGDRIRMMRHTLDENIIIRSVATRGKLGGLAPSVNEALQILTYAACDPIIIETVGVGQTEVDIAGVADLTLLVVSPGFGDGIQAMKAGLFEIADIFVCNKMDSPGADILAKEMQILAREENRKIALISALEGTGCDNLLDLIYEFKGN